MRALASSMLLAFTLCAAMPGAESVTFATDGGGESCDLALAALNELTGMSQSIDVELLIGNLNRRVISMHLINASQAGVRQALAEAMGCWWVRMPRQSDTFQYTTNPQLPLGALDAHWNTSALRRRADCDSLVHGLLAPWLSQGAAIAYQYGDGSWPSTLDDAGEAHLIEVLGCLERSQAHCPDLLPDPDSPDLERVLTTPVRGGSWDDLLHNLARAGNISVVLGPDMVPSDQAPDELPAGTLSSALQALTTSGISAIIRHGVVCLSHHGSGDQEHPAQRRRVALLPIGHLLPSRADGDVLVQTISQHIQADSWGLPGWGLYFLDDSRSLLVAADPPLIHRVLDALDLIDQLGFERGIGSLKALPGAER